MTQEVKDELMLRKKLFILELASATSDVTKTCREFKIPRSSFYDWKKNSTKAE